MILTITVQAMLIVFAVALAPALWVLATQLAKLASALRLGRLWTQLRARLAVAWGGGFPSRSHGYSVERQKFHFFDSHL